MQHPTNVFFALLVLIAGFFVSCNQTGTTTEQTSTTTDSLTAPPPPPAAPASTAMVISHQVKDYAKWRPFFDKDEPMRQAAQMQVMGVFRDLADTNYISISMIVNNLENAKQFAASEDLKKVMTEAGVTGQPEIKFYEFVFSDPAAGDGSDNRMFLVAKISDYNTFKQVFDEREPVRKGKGISTVVVAKNLEDPSEVAVALTAADMQVLKDHMASPEVKEAMQKAGVIGEPMIQYAKKAGSVAM